MSNISEIIRRCIEESNGNRLAAVELAYAYTDACGWDARFAVLAAIDRQFGPEEQITNHLLLEGEHATIIQNNWRDELTPTRVRRFKVSETRPYFYESDNGACRWPGQLALSYLEHRKRKKWEYTHYLHFGNFFLIERDGKTLFDSREYPLFKELVRLRVTRLQRTPEFLEAYRRVTSSDDISPAAVTAAIRTNAIMREIERVLAEARQQRLATERV